MTVSNGDVEAEATSNFLKMLAGSNTDLKKDASVAGTYRWWMDFSFR